MRKTGYSVLLAGLMTMPTLVIAHDYPTDVRVQYVLDCMTANQKLNVYESVTKCSCVIDEIANVFTLRDYEDATIGYMMKNMAADRGGVFRDDENVDGDIRSLKQIQAEAYKTCKLRK